MLTSLRLSLLLCYFSTSLSLIASAQTASNEAEQAITPIFRVTHNSKHFKHYLKDILRKSVQGKSYASYIKFSLYENNRNEHCVKIEYSADELNIRFWNSQNICTLNAFKKAVKA